jgi:hypothetical protein
MTTEPSGAPTIRRVPAPGLRETADIWFDTGRDPVVVWDPAGRHFELQDPLEPAHTLRLVSYPHGVGDPERIARVLADGLAACDFPPTGDGAAAGHVASALRVAGVDPPPA